MANTAQAKKRARQAEDNRQRNVALRSKMRTALKKVFADLKNNQLDAARAHYQTAASTVDKMVSKGIIHANKAARHKSRLSAHIKKLSQQAAVV